MSDVPTHCRGRRVRRLDAGGTVAGGISVRPSWARSEARTVSQDSAALHPGLLRKCLQGFSFIVSPIRGAPPGRNYSLPPFPALRCAPCWAILDCSLREWETMGRRDSIFQVGCEPKDHRRLLSRQPDGRIAKAGFMARWCEAAARVNARFNHPGASLCRRATPASAWPHRFRRSSRWRRAACASGRP
jgi:hypothetical protein